MLSEIYFELFEGFTINRFTGNSLAYCKMFYTLCPWTMITRHLLGIHRACRIYLVPPRLKETTKTSNESIKGQFGQLSSFFEGLSLLIDLGGLKSLSYLQEGRNCGNNV